MMTRAKIEEMRAHDGDRAHHHQGRLDKRLRLRERTGNSEREQTHEQKPTRPRLTVSPLPGAKCQTTNHGRRDKKPPLQDGALAAADADYREG